MKRVELERLVLQHVNSPNYRPIKPRGIATQLNVPPESVAELKKAIKRLVKRGKIAYGSNHLVQVAGAGARNQVTGVFRRAAGGFGFVRPTSTAASVGRDDDVFIPAHKTHDAASGDIVLVKVGRRGGTDRNRRAGEIVEVVERETHQFVGTYFEDTGTGFVQVDGTLFSQPILIGDPGAKGAQPNDKVVIEMVRFPTHAHSGEGVITEVLGDRSAAGVDTLMIMREFGLPDEFSDEVIQDAREQSDQFDESIEEGRVDLTNVTVLTIDPHDARDFDDAISLERIENGHWRLGVHIADVAHFVRSRSPLDREARKRATSVYLADRVIPMLPEAISNNLASLQPDRIRFAKTVFIEFTADGARVAADVCSSAIRSDRRFTYEEVDDFLQHQKKWKPKLSADVFQLLQHMFELAMVLRRRRLERGAIELTMPEIKLELDRVGRVQAARRVENTESHQIIEEFMLGANEAVAEWLRDRELLFLRRIHENPDPRKLKALTEFVRELRIAADSLESRFEIKRVLAEVAGRPEQDAVNYAILRSMQKAVYSPRDEGHYALASDCYCHFTSPIRRYPDLTIHRLLGDLLREATPVNEFGPLLSLGEHCSDREQRAEAAERELTKLKLLHYLSDRIGQQMDAVVTGVQDFGLFVQGVELPAEGLIHVNSLTNDYYDYDSTSHTLSGRRGENSFRLGDSIRVEIAYVNLDRRELDFRFVKKLNASSGKKTSGRQNRKGTPKKTVATKSRTKKTARQTKRSKKKDARRKSKR